jgi:hypothetical protein
LEGKFIDIADDNFHDALANIETKFLDTTSRSLANEVKGVLDKFLQRGAEKGARDGKWYQAQRSIYASEASRPGAKGKFAGEIVEALDDAFERVAPSVKGDIDKRWAQAKQLERIAKMGGPEVSEGLLPLVSLNSLAKKSPGSQEWRDLINSGTEVLKGRLGNSGTAARTQANKFIDSTEGLGYAAAAAYQPHLVIPGLLGGRLGARYMAGGGSLDVTRAMPNGSLLGDPRLAQGLAAQAGLLQ